MISPVIEPLEESLSSPQGDPDGDTSDIDALGPMSKSEQRQAQKAIFEKYAASLTSRSTKQEIRQNMDDDAEDTNSVQDILMQQKHSTPITDPRDYQIEIFELAKQENIIAVLDTGTGKTHIATLLLRWTLENEIQSCASGKAQKTAFFLVDSVNLVFQQTAVLDTGLDYKVTGIYGGSKVSFWTQQVWDGLLAENMVIVCTADILLQCLRQAFVHMSDISLLIFDEAHHAKLNHAYARIMKDFFAESEVRELPRIFGMTASPVDAKEDVQHAARDLECLLHSKIVTVANSAFLSKNIPMPQESILHYDHLASTFETALYQKLKSHLGDSEPYTRLFKTAKVISAELGSWCADMYWTFAFSEETASKVETRLQYQHTMSNATVAKLDESISRLRDASKFVKSLNLQVPVLGSSTLSSKVSKLIEHINESFEQQPNNRCIVFVQRKATAHLLHKLFERLGNVNIRSGSLVGTRNGALADIKETVRSQVLTTVKFRSGELNCLFATSVAEEGLDIPQCNLIIRFDLYRTMIQYIQSRGRARQKGSSFVHMIERYNSLHQQTYFDAREAEIRMRRFCKALPQDRQLGGDDMSIEQLRFNEHSYQTFVDKDTNATLTYDSSLQVLARFVLSLPRQGDIPTAPNFVISTQQGRFVCEVVLPDNSPVRSATGRPAARKSIAKRSAAFEACLQLRQHDALDGRFNSTYHRVLPQMRNALLALNENKKHIYQVKLKPDQWKFGRGSIPNELSATLIDFSDGLDQQYRRLLLLSRTPLEQFPSFQLFLNSGKATDVILTPIPDVLKIEDSEINLLTSFLLRVWDDVFAKVFQEADGDMSYWIAPVKSNPDYGNVREIIDWELLREVNIKLNFSWDFNMPGSLLKNRYLVDRVSGANRFISCEVVEGMKPTDPVPNIPENLKAKYPDVLAYSITAGTARKKQIRETCDMRQPVLLAKKIGFRRNFLTTSEKNEGTEFANCYICPQFLSISVLPVDVVTAFYVFPSIIYRIECYMIALDASKMLGLRIEPGLALEAITKDSDSTDDENAEGMKFFRGMGKNYERLEFLGDCFLKLATSLSLFVQCPKDNEFEYHVRRMCMLCNKNLFTTAIDIKLPEYIRSLAFSRRTWYPEGLTMLKGKGMDKQKDTILTHALGDKTIADVCEAFIGAAFYQDNKVDAWKPENWDQAVKAVTIFVRSPDHTMTCWGDYVKVYNSTKSASTHPTAVHLALIDKLEKKHPYQFKDPKLARSAFVHPSIPFIWEGIPNYERLEFIGDSLLDMVIVSYIYYGNPERDPQWLTEHKMAMVSNKFLGALCVNLGFHTHLLHNTASLRGQIRAYVEELEEAERGAKDVTFWNNVSDPPKCLADIVESYVGAIFVDSEFNFAEVQRFFDRNVKPFFEDLTLYDTYASNHAMIRLQTLMNKTFGCHGWRIGSSPIPSVLPSSKKLLTTMLMVHYQVICDGGVRTSERYGKIKVAEKALGMLEGLSKKTFQTLYACDCSGNAD